MLLARVAGTVVATRKDTRLEGKKLLVVKTISPDGRDDGNYLVAVDTVDAGFRETVLIVQGSSARMAAECKDRPVDTAIIGVVDTIRLDEEKEVAATAARK
jgi:microcompartment protein CcmK/EutM